MKQLLNTKIFYACVLCVSALLLSTGCSKKNDVVPPKLTVTTFASGLTSPNGIATDNAGNVWVADQGTGKNDGKIWVIKPNARRINLIIAANRVAALVKNFVLKTE